LSGDHGKSRHYNTSVGPGSGPVTGDFDQSQEERQIVGRSSDTVSSLLLTYHSYT